MRPSARFVAIASLVLAALDARAMDDIMLAPLRQAVIRGAEEGTLANAYVSFGGSTVRAKLVAADDATITVVVAGAEVPLTWDKVGLRHLAGMVARVAVDCHEWWALGEAYAELGMANESDSAWFKAAQLDDFYKELLTERRAKAEKEAAEARAAGAARETPKRESDAPRATRDEAPRVFPPWKGATPERGLRADRPRLFVTPDRLRFLRSSGSSLRSYAAMKGYCKGVTDRTYFAMMQAIVFLIDGDETYGRLAVKAALRIARTKRARGGESGFSFYSMALVAKVYDWCHPLMTDDERARLASWMLREYDTQKGAYRGEHYHNYNATAANAFALAGYALHGDEPRAAELIENGVRERFEKGILGALAKGNAGGAWAEGEGYAYTSVPEVIEIAEAARTCEGIDYFDDARGKRFFYHRIPYMMFATYPGVHGSAQMVFFVRGDGKRGGNTLDARGNLVSLIYAYAGTRMASVAEDFISKPGYVASPYRDGLWMDVLWGRPRLPRLPVQAFRTSHHAAGQGVVFMQSDWSDDATHVSFICGDHYCYHAHPDSGAFTIVRYGEELAVDSGEYDGNGTPHMCNYQSRTIAHNSIVLAGYEDNEVRLRRVGPADDGGQPLGKVERFVETGNMLAYDPARAYTYAAGDLTPSYKGRVKAWVRHVLFVKPETIVVFDVVRAPVAHYPRWLLHTWNEPDVADAVFRAEKGKAALHGTVLLPKKRAVKKLRGFRVAGKNYPPQGARSKDTAQWRLEVTPKDPIGTTAFLVVMHATASSLGRAPAATLLDDGGVGCTVGGGVKVRFKSNGAPGGELTIGGRTVKLAERVLADPAP